MSETADLLLYCHRFFYTPRRSFTPNPNYVKNWLFPLSPDNALSNNPLIYIYIYLYFFVFINYVSHFMGNTLSTITPDRLFSFFQIFNFQSSAISFLLR